MATYTQLPSGHWRAQVRKRGTYKAETFRLKRDAIAWATTVEAAVHSIRATGYATAPADATLADLIDKHEELTAEKGRSQVATLKLIRRELGSVKLTNLTALTLRDFIDRRAKQGAGGVTIAGDLSTLSAVLKWGKHARQLDLPVGLALEARASLVHRGLNTRGVEREREPTDAELERLYAHWRSNPRQKVDLETLCKFALASGMRLGEITALRAEDVNAERRTVLIRDRKDPRNKAGNNQLVPLLPEAWAIVEPRIKARPTGPIFDAKAATVSTTFTRACQAVDPPIVDLHFHDLRHRATAAFFRKGLQIPQVALLTGHKTWQMLRRYTDVKPDDVHDAFAQAAALKAQAAVLLSQADALLQKKTKRGGVK